MGPVRGWGPHGLSIRGCCSAKWAAAGRKEGPEWSVSYFLREIGNTAVYVKSSLTCLLRVTEEGLHAETQPGVTS